MAFYTQSIDSNQESGKPSSVRGRVRRVLSVFAHAADRSQAVHRMQALSDAELAQMGVRREDIVRRTYGAFTTL